MSTTIDAIFCYLTNTTEFANNGRTISNEDANTRFCGEQNRYLDYEKAIHKVGSPRVQFVTVRDPLQRFISGYVDKCVRWKLSPYDQRIKKAIGS
ncbi:unnamed protein product [Cylicocyclus nassatus]|uniref:Sulfotransferase n=1 Tax=Cylicocyclus nassatus TaxID=53992 RepID=A0AA36DKK0_CYLNA|nr:unnamed protein product [Cylicocyclus nassatus]